MFKESFLKAIEGLNLAVYAKEYDSFINLLMEWNQKLNLVGRQQSLERIYHLHLLDSLLAVPYLEGAGVICDVGSGAGFPALCWALSLPEKKFFLIEKSPKKCQFLTYAVKKLDLAQRVTILNSPVEQVKGMNPDLLTCRALTSIADFLKITQHLACDKTKWLMLKALDETISKEIADCNQQEWMFQVIRLNHPTQDVTRNLVEITPKK